MSIHEIKNYNKRDTQLVFEKLILNDNYIFKKSMIIENNERLSTIHEKCKNEIFELILDLSRTNDNFKIRIFYKFRKKRA